MAATLTPSGLQYVQGTDVESAYPAIDQANMTILNSTVFWQSGTFASIPTASTVPPGTHYYATDTARLYINETGSAWSLASPFQLTPSSISSNTTAVQGTLYYPSAALTLTLPSASGLPAIPIGVAATYAASASSPVTVTVGTGGIAGVGLSATSFTLGVPSASVILMPAGSGWQIISGQADTGWAALTLATNIVTTGGFTPSARLRGDTVELKGGIQNNTGTSDAGTLATLPAAVPSPVDAVWEPVVEESNTGAHNLRISNAGLISIPGGLPSSATVSLNGVRFPLS